MTPPTEDSGRVRVLVVDDDVYVCRTLRRILERADIGDVTIVSDPTAALDRCDASDYDAILLDLHMPELDGFQLMRAFVEQIGDDQYVPILVLTGDSRLDVREKALASGAKDFVQKPFEPTEVVARIQNLIETRQMHERLRSFNEVLAKRVEEQTADVVAAKLEVLDRLARAAEYRDDMTGLHAARVGALSGLLARELGLEERAATNLEQAAPLHDIGKIGIPDSILRKRASLTEGEFRVIRRHTLLGAGILAGSRFDLLQTAEQIALTHHEHWNGAGYPNGLAGEAIPEEGRIVAVADAFDTLTNDRPYRMACSCEHAIEEIVRCRGRQFAPDVVDALCRLYRRGVLASMIAEVDAGGEPDPAHHESARAWDAAS